LARLVTITRSRTEPASRVERARMLLASREPALIRNIGTRSRQGRDPHIRLKYRRHGVRRTMLPATCRVYQPATAKFLSRKFIRKNIFFMKSIWGLPATSTRRSSPDRHHRLRRNRQRRPLLHHRTNRHHPSRKRQHSPTHEHNDHSIEHSIVLLDHRVGGGQQRLRHGQSERLLRPINLAAKASGFLLTRIAYPIVRRGRRQREFQLRNDI
jgi:hypothetical protein